MGVFSVMLVAQSCLTLCDLMNYCLPGSSVPGILQARILEWVAMPFSRGSSWHRDQTWVSCIAGRFFTIWATREALGVFYMHLFIHTYWERGWSHPALHLSWTGRKRTFISTDVLWWSWGLLRHLCLFRSSHLLRGSVTKVKLESWGPERLRGRWHLGVHKNESENC